MKFPMIIYKDEGSACCGLLPDFPGLFLAEDTLEALVASVQDGAEVWMEGEDPGLFPAPSSLQQAMENQDAQGAPVILVDVDTSFLKHQETR